MKKCLIVLVLVVSLFCALVRLLSFNANFLIPTVNNYFENEYGISLKTNKLKLKLGTSIILDIPNATLFYNKTQEFAELNSMNIKLAILPLVLKKYDVKLVNIDDIKLTLNIDSIGNIEITKYLKIPNKIPTIKIKRYNILLNDYSSNDKYTFVGSSPKIRLNKIFLLETTGQFFINSQKYINYDIKLKINNFIFKKKENYNISKILLPIKQQKIFFNIASDINLKESNEIFDINGFLNIDKFNYKNNNYSGNKLFLNFKDNKIFVDSLLKTNPNDLICVKGVVINKKEPYCDISFISKNTNIKEVLDILKLVPNISNLNKIKNAYGFINSNFNFKGTLKNFSSKGSCKLSNVYLDVDGIRITNLNSDIDLNNNEILIKNAKTFVNGAPISASGSISKNKINIVANIDNMNLNNFKYKNLKLNKGVLNGQIILSGNFNKLNKKIEISLKELNGTYNAINFILNNAILKNIGADSFNIIASNINLKNTKLKTIIIPKLITDINNNTVDIKHFNLISNSNTTNLKIIGRINEYQNLDKLKYNFDIQGNVNPAIISTLSSLNSTCPVLLKLQGDKKHGNLSGQILQEKGTKQFSFNQPVVYKINTQISQKNIHLKEVSVYTYCKKPEKLFSLEGQITDIKNPKLSIKVLFNKCCVNIEHYFAKINGHLNIDGSVNSPKIIGNINLPMFSDKYGCLSAKNMTLNIDKKLTTFNCELAKILNSEMSLDGVAETNITKPHIKSLNIKSKYIDLENILMLLTLYKNKPKPNIDKGNFECKKMLVKTPSSYIYISDVNSIFSLKDSIMKIESLSSNLYNGKIVGNLKLDIKNSTYSGTLQGRYISSYNMTKAFTKLNENISGQLDFDMNFESSIKSKYLKNANIKFIIRNGQMKKLGKVEHLLYAQNIISDYMMRTSLAVVTRAITTKDTGVFKYLNGILVLNDDNVSIKSIKMLGPNMSFYLVGKYNLSNNIVNAKILGRLSNTITSSLGAFGNLSMEKFKIALTGEDNYKYSLQTCINNIPQLPQRNTKEFESIIHGPADANTSVKSFKWISETEKEYKTRDVIQTNVSIPSFIDKLPY